MTTFQSLGITATSDGLTTGLVPAHAFAVPGLIEITSANADHIVTLPAIADLPLGAEADFYIGSNGCEVRTVASSGTTINDVDSDGTNEAAIPATHFFKVKKVSSTGFLLVSWTSAGAAATVTPDTA